jgi:hypothetical protein
MGESVVVGALVVVGFLVVVEVGSCGSVPVVDAAVEFVVEVVISVLSVEVVLVTSEAVVSSVEEAVVVVVEAVVVVVVVAAAVLSAPLQPASRPQSSAALSARLSRLLCFINELLFKVMATA